MSIAENLNQTHLKCSSCGTEMDLNELVVQEIINANKEKLDLDYQEKLQVELTKKEEEIRLSNKQRFEALNNDLNEKNEALENLTKIQIENERLKRDFELIQKRSELELERAISDAEVKIAHRIEKSISEKYEFQLAEKEKQIEAVKKSAREAVQKANQGSMQIQGEVQEAAIEKWLLNNFPLDNIHEVKKGAMGADCLHVINEYDMQNCGTIYYESKNTKNFNIDWITKLKKDMQAKNADVGVLVTKTYPKDVTRMKVIDGIYICSFEEFKGLCAVLRNTIIELHKHKVVNDNVHDKKELLYNFLSSKQFIAGLERIVESFVQMNRNLEKEERLAVRNFESRRTLLGIARDNTIKIFTNFSSIAGSSVKNLSLLEFESDSTLSNVELLQRKAEDGTYN